MDYGWVWFFRDVTEQKAAESALHAATEQVRHYARELENRVESRTADLNAANTRLKALSRRLVDLQEAERRRIARELHDQIGQQLTGLKLLLGRDAGSERGQTAAVKEARLVVLDLVQQVRQICLDLRPQVLDDLGLLIALKWHFKTYRRQTGITVRFRYRGFDESKVSRDKGIAVFRIVQEALTNVARHAKVRTVFVQVSTSRGSLCVRVEDEGVGYNPRAMGHRAGSGLGTMRERVAIAGGTIKVTARRHAGCRIQVETPLGGESLSS